MAKHLLFTGDILIVFVYFRNSVYDVLMGAHKTMLVAKRRLPFSD